VRIRFSSVLVATLLGLLLSVAALIATTSYLNARTNAETLSTDMIGQAALRVDQRVRAQLDVAKTESVQTARFLARGELVPENREDLAHYFVDTMSAQNALTYTSFGSEANGDMTQVMRAADDQLEVRFLERQPDGALRLIDEAVKNNTFEPKASQPDARANDPRPRPYYRLARDAKKPVWTEVYTFFGSGGRLASPGVTYATPVFRDGTLLGVLSADFDLRTISSFLSSLDLLQHGLAFVVEQRADGTRSVIAHPTPEILTRPVSPGATERETFPFEEISDPRVVAMVKALPVALPKDKTDPTPTRFMLGDTAFVGSYLPLADGNLSWVICVVAPEDDILGPVRKSNRQTEIIVAAGVGMALLLALFLGRVLARPLRRLANETEAIGRFELDSRENVRSPFLEVDRLAVAMEEMKRGLRSFRKFVPADLVHELLKSGKEAQVGGERKTLTIHFSDIAGFTSIAETLPPEELVSYLGDYLEAMTEPIHRSGGTVDKYIGDAIMAFWGAPQSDDDHALHACEAALANRARLEKLNEKWVSEGRPRFDARAALNTGEVIVGNLGTGSKLDYTVIGDAVNLASRLEGLNKRYGTSLMISEDTLALVRDRVVVRPLDRVSVKGKNKSVAIYELVGMCGAVSKEEELAAAAHTEAFDLYLARKFEDASMKLREILATRKDDVAAKGLLARCADLIANPPDADWDGSQKMTEK
jgi:adenylate cyclase